MKAYGGSTDVAPLTLSPVAKWWRVVNTTPRPLYPRERTRVPVEQAAGGPQSWFGEEKSLSTLPAFELPIVQPVAQSLC